MNTRSPHSVIRRRALIRGVAGTAVAAATTGIAQREVRGAVARGQIRTIVGLVSFSAPPFTGIPGPGTKSGLASHVALASRTVGIVVVGTTQLMARPGQELSVLIQWSELTGAVRRIGGTAARGNTGASTEVAVSALDFDFVFPTALAIEANGDILVASVRRPWNGALLRIRTTGAVELVAGGGPLPLSAGSVARGAQLIDPTALAVDGGGNIFIAELGAGRIRRVSRDGRISTVAGGSGSNPVRDGPNPTAGRLLAPAGLALDNDGGLYISEARAGRIRRLGRDGRISTVVDTGRPQGPRDATPGRGTELHGPHGLAVSPDGTVYVADQGNHRVRAISPAGSITTIAGFGRPGYGGDGGAATAAVLNSPTALALAGSSLYVGDEGNRVVREIGL